MKLLIRTNPIPGESLSGFLQRLSKLNYICPYDLWNLCKREGSCFPAYLNTGAIDSCPESFLDFTTLASITDVNEDLIKNLTFLPVYRKLGINQVTSHTGVLRTLIEPHRRFCPICLKELSIYHLNWQIREIAFCPIHNLSLVSNCGNCGKKIPILSTYSQIGYCPNCDWDLTQTISQTHEKKTDDERILEDWAYLFNPSSPNLETVNTLSNEESLGMRVLFTSQNFENELTRKEQTTLYSVFQIARNTKSEQRYVHLSTILHFARQSNISLKEFFTREIPQEFITSILSQKTKMINNYSCIAPWCSHYKKPGLLKQTTTHSAKLKSGEERIIHMYCNSCSVEYGLRKKDSAMIERGYFIDFAWATVKGELGKGRRFKELIKIFNVPQDKLKRAIIFLAANNLINHDQVPFSLPESHDPDIKNQFQDFLLQGIPARQIQKKLSLNHINFLFYWLSADIRRVYLNEVVKSAGRYKIKKDRTIEFERVIQILLSKNLPVSTQEICKELKICPGTLENWGLRGKIKDYKKF